MKIVSLITYPHACRSKPVKASFVVRTQFKIFFQSLMLFCVSGTTRTRWFGPADILQNGATVTQKRQIVE